MIDSYFVKLRKIEQVCFTLGVKMKVLISTLIAVLFLLVANANADEKADLAKVRQLANQIITGSDVRKTVSVYNNNGDNPCAPDGTSYVVNVQVRKSVVKDVGGIQSREWQDFDQYSVSKDDLQKGKGLNDTICQE
jgi:hypothetical protein